MAAAIEVGQGLPFSNLRYGNISGEMMLYEGRIGRFQVKRPIGRGFAGEVSLVFDPDYNREIALKVIHTGLVDSDVLEAEKRGAEIQEQLSREVSQIARVYERGQIEDKFYIAMEFVDGDDLSSLLHSPLHPGRALDFAVQLCTILEACSRVPLGGEGRHDRVVHGDIKPQNIRIEAGDRVRLLDFGVAKSVSPTRRYTGNIFGSLPYLSPERLAENRVGAESDLWSVSVVLFQMLTGELPLRRGYRGGSKRSDPARWTPSTAAGQPLAAAAAGSHPMSGSQPQPTVSHRGRPETGVVGCRNRGGLLRLQGEGT